MSSAPLIGEEIGQSQTLSSRRLGPSRLRESSFRSFSSVDDLEGSTFGAGKFEYLRRQKEAQGAVKDVDKLLAKETGRCGDGREAAEEAACALESEEQDHSLRDKLAVSLSNYVNVVLFAFKLYASLATRSLAIIASTLDSLLDILAGGILWYTSLAMAQQDPVRYPVGKRRMQPVGIIIFAAVMATLGFQVLLEGVSMLIEGPEGETHISTAVLHWVLLVLLGVIAAKLALFALCRVSTNDIVQAYATDHFLDVVTNSVGLVSALLGSRLAWWVDPCGAIAIALYTIINWSKTVFENAESLIGVTASPEFLAEIIRIAVVHDSRIRRVESIRAWLLGSHYIVEVDIELPGSMTIREGHDIGESLQNKLEALPEVDRAFVHLDHEEEHLNEHTGKSHLLDVASALQPGTS